MKGMRLGREKTGSSVGKKKRTDKQLKQKHKEERETLDEGEEVARNAPYFVDALCETFDESMPHLPDKLLGCGMAMYLAQPGCQTDWLDAPSNERWGVVGSLPPRRANKLAASEHLEFLNSVQGKPNVCAILTGVEYGKPPHGESKPCSAPEYQRAAFEVHCQTALKWAVPLVLVLRPDSKEAEESDQAVRDALQWLSESGVPQDYKILFSSWLGTPQSALMVLKRFPNSILGVNGSVTFRSSSNLREIAFDTPLTRIVLESNAPNAPPTNLVLAHSPWTILPIAACVAEQKRTDVQTLLAAANENAAKFFGKTLRRVEPVAATEEAEDDDDEGKEKSVPLTAAAAQQPVQLEKDDSFYGDQDQLEMEDLKRFLE